MMPKRHFSSQDYFFDRELLTDGDPPNDRGCRACGKVQINNSESKIILVSPPDRAPGGGLPAQEGCRQQEEAGERSEGETEPGGAKDGGAIIREEERSTESRSGQKIIA